MAFRPSPRLARLFWIIPAFLIYLMGNQAKVAYDLRHTWTQGQPAVAEVMGYEKSNRADVTYDFVSLRIPLQDGSVLVKEKMSLPHTLLPRVEKKTTLDVHVLPGAPQSVVIDTLMPAHWLIAAAQAGMCLLGALLSAIGLGWLMKKG